MGLASPPGFPTWHSGYPRCKVVLDHYTLVLSHVHFGVEKPDGEREDDYTTIRGASHSLTWTEVNEKIPFCSSQNTTYTLMEERELWDAEFATFARENLVRRDAS